ncbi:hypothetical protein ON010_g17293 [Phytophthora cinnamomi]|nr:hypothetical protein ON010_g17293 [Phytophthora cinnamomi]
MGKRKTREPENPFTQSTEPLTDNHKDLDKLRLDLWLTTIKQENVIKLIRNEIPDRRDFGARNVVHETTELLKRHIEKTEKILEATRQLNLALQEPAFQNEA